MDRDANTISNHSRFFQTKFLRAHELYKANQKSQADDLCRELISDFACPRLLQVHAWQLRSLCTRDYFHAKSYLRECFPILDDMPRVYGDAVPKGDPSIEKQRAHTQKMLDELNSDWRKHWDGFGLEPPMEEDQLDAARKALKQKKKEIEEEKKQKKKEEEELSRTDVDTESSEQTGPKPADPTSDATITSQEGNQTPGRASSQEELDEV